MYENVDTLPVSSFIIVIVIIQETIKCLSIRVFLTTHLFHIVQV